MVLLNHAYDRRHPGYPILVKDWSTDLYRVADEWTLHMFILKGILLIFFLLPTLMSALEKTIEEFGI